MADRLASWPDVLRRLAELIGPDLTLRLAQARGGLDRVYIPKDPTLDHPWAAVIGAEAWTKVVKAFGGERVDLPSGAFVQPKKVAILDLAEQKPKLSKREIARRTGASERYVRRLLSASEG